MHELSIAMSIVEIATQEAARHVGHVTAVHLKLGPLSGVIREALLPAFELARVESLSLRDASLIIEDVPLTGWCAVCNAEQPVASIQWLCCPVCHSPVSAVLHGKELEVVALEMDDA